MAVAGRALNSCALQTRQQQSPQLAHQRAGMVRSPAGVSACFRLPWLLPRRWPARLHCFSPRSNRRRAPVAVVLLHQTRFGQGSGGSPRWGVGSSADGCCSPVDQWPIPFCIWPQDDALLDDIIDRLLDVRTGRPGKQVALSETEVRGWAGMAVDGVKKLSGIASQAPASMRAHCRKCNPGLRRTALAVASLPVLLVDPPALPYGKGDLHEPAEPFGVGGAHQDLR